MGSPTREPKQLRLTRHTPKFAETRLAVVCWSRIRRGCADVEWRFSKRDVAFRMRTRGWPIQLIDRFPVVNKLPLVVNVSLEPLVGAKVERLHSAPRPRAAA